MLALSWRPTQEAVVLSVALTVTDVAASGKVWGQGSSALSHCGQCVSGQLQCYRPEGLDA